MVGPLKVGDPVQTPLGKGIVREARTNGRVVVEIAGRRVVFDSGVVRPQDPPRKQSSRKKPGPSTPTPATVDVPPDGHAAPAEVDLHGLSVADALARVESALNEALLAGRLQLRLIHGRSGGRIKSALHQQLRAMPSLRGFRLDPTNDGVTIVDL